MAISASKYAFSMFRKVFDIFLTSLFTSSYQKNTLLYFLPYQPNTLMLIRRLDYGFFR